MASPDPANDLRTASKLFGQAQDRLRQGDHAGAIEMLEMALQLIPDAPAYTKTRSTILFALAGAHERDFDRRAAERGARGAVADAAPLRQAIARLDEYEQALEPDDRDSQSIVARRRATLQAKLRAVEAAQAAAADAKRKRDAPPRVVMLPSDPTDRPSPVDRPPPSSLPRDLTIAGGVVAGLGALSLAAMVGALEISQDADRKGLAAMMLPDSDPQRSAELKAQQSRGLTANTVAWATGIAGGALVVVGVALITAGAIKRRDQLVVAPIVDRAGAGLSLRLRF